MQENIITKVILHLSAFCPVSENGFDSKATDNKVYVGHYKLACELYNLS